MGLEGLVGGYEGHQGARRLRAPHGGRCRSHARHQAEGSVAGPRGKPHARSPPGQAVRSAPRGRLSRTRSSPPGGSSGATRLDDFSQTLFTLSRVSGGLGLTNERKRTEKVVRMSQPLGQQRWESRGSTWLGPLRSSASASVDASEAGQGVPIGALQPNEASSCITWAP
jgi:hypothetical protein